MDPRTPERLESIPARDVPWYRRPLVREILLRVLAVATGAAIGAMCPRVPAKWQLPCNLAERLFR